jgi:hypothetical protein
MKNLLFVLGVLLGTFPGTVTGQISIGAYGGIHTNRVKVRGIAEEWRPNNRTLVAVNTGIYVEIPLLNGFSVQPGLNYLEKGFRVRVSTEDFNLGNVPVVAGVEAIPRLRYIEMPLLLKYTYGEGLVRPYIFAGPHFSYAMDGVIDYRATAIVTFKLGRNNINLDNDIYRRFEVGGLAGLGVAFTTGPFDTFFQGSFQHGFTNLLDPPLIDLRLFNYGFNVTGGLSYSF